MAKLTQKEKIQEAFLFAQSIRHIANRLMQYSKDYSFSGGISYARQLQEECDEIIKKL